MSTIIKPERIYLKDHSTITEKIIQDKICEDPSILGLGDLMVRDKERIQPRAGRLDILLQDPETARRYEVEIQLGKTDESHIIRALEYWDIEKKRYPQYEHCAVIVAEDVTSRFLNIISLFNGFIPLVAIQMNAYKFGNDIALVFTKVMDEMPLGPIEEDEGGDIKQNSTTREFWIKKASAETLQLAEKYVEIIKEIDPSIQVKYTKVNLRLVKDLTLIPFIRIRLKKKHHFVLVFVSPKSEAIDQFIEQNDFDYMDYLERGTKYRLLISNEDLVSKKEALKELFSIIEKQYNI